MRHLNARGYMKSLLVGVSLAFCGGALADTDRGDIDAALNHEGRPTADRERDTLRRPGEILAFAGVAAGMTVLDINSAGGYYTELLSHLVGPEGKVFAHNGPVYWSFMKETVPERFTNNRLANVSHIHNGSEVFSLPADSVDIAMAVLAYHDYYFTHEARPGGGHENVPAVLASLYKAIKPGGRVVIVDHVAAGDAGPADFDKLHRIDPAFVRRQMEAAGFMFAGSSDVLQNSVDDPRSNPFGKDIRGRTSRFVYRFEKAQ